LGWSRSTGSRRVATALVLGATLCSAGVVGAAGAQAERTAAPELRAVSCHTSTVCLAAGDSAVVGFTGTSGWKILTPPAGAEMLNGAACPGLQTCYLAGSGFGDNGAIWRTTDGGMTWHAQLTAITGGFFLAVSCPSVMVCEAVGNEGSIYGTADGGKAWEQQQVPASANLIYGIACPSVTTCEAVGYGGTGLALRTTDGGTTWTRQQLPRSVQDLQGVACPSVTVCVAVGLNVTQAGSKQSGTVVTTTDGGVTWIRQHNPAGFTDLTAVACPSAQVCEAAGLGPRAVIGTADGGTTWARQDVPGSVFLQGIDCPTVNVCQTVGENADDVGVAYGTTDSGRTWMHLAVRGGRNGTRCTRMQPGRHASPP
jgi:photosystem II stability/assembly factor-like uncharacterized protein